MKPKSGKDEGLILGTPSYMPPEQAKPKGGFGEVRRGVRHVDAQPLGERPRLGQQWVRLAQGGPPVG